MSVAKTFTASEFRESPVYWFVRLEKSRERQDHEHAAEAVRELRRLGVDVRFTQRGDSHA